MRRKLAIAIALLLTLGFTGCGYMAAGIDIDGALKVAADVNAKNVQTVAADKMALRDREAVKLESAFEAKLGASTGGVQAVQILAAYRKKKSELAQLRAVDVAQHGKMVDNALLMVALIGERIGLRAWKDSLLGRIPAVSQLREMSEHKSTEYINTLLRGPD